MKRRGISAAIVLVWAASGAAAQTWQTKAVDDGTYASARVILPGVPFGAMCAARSVQKRPLIEGGWHEATVAPPWHFLFEASEVLIPGTIAPRDDILLILDGTQYRLPRVQWNELDGAWQVSVGMGAPVVGALRVANSVVLQVGTQQAWQVPATGLSAALEQAQTFCGATWTATGFGGGNAPATTNPGPGELTQNDTATAPDLVAISQGHINRLCGGSGTAGPRGVSYGDIDLDGAQDILIDWSDVTCAGTAPRPFCGASLCGGDLLLSRDDYVLREGSSLLGMSHGITPLNNGNQGVTSSGNLSMCQSSDPCGFVSFWDGRQLKTTQY